MQDHIDSLVKTDLKIKTLPAADSCLKDGDQSNNEAYHGHWYVNAYKYPKDQGNLLVGG